MIKPIPYKRLAKQLAQLSGAAIAITVCIAIMAYASLQVWYGWYADKNPLEIKRYDDRGTLVLDRNDKVLNMFAAGDGLIRLKADITAVDKRYLDVLVAYEDKRFYDHGGVDYLALLRATGQAVVNGRIISGGSTLTMQVAKLLEPRERTWRSKLIEMARANQLENEYSKDEILGLYMTLAPYGGPYEGVRAASWVYFGREPKDLTWGEAALLAVLPQSPTRFRPDRNPKIAARARDKVLARVSATLNISEGDLNANKGFRLRLASETAVKANRNNSLHFTFRVKDRASANDTVIASISSQYQAGATNILKQAIASLDKTSSAAAIIVDSWTGETIAYVGSPDYMSKPRSGAIDMTQAIRSPGSTLKPFIYGLAFEDGILHPLTLIRDEKIRFGDYAPTNFKDRFHGEVSIQYALQKSLNIPAVKVLSKIGAERFASELALAGTPLSTPGDKEAGLALALGGTGINLENLVRLYTALSRDGRLRASKLIRGEADTEGKKLLSETSRAWLEKILKGVSPPAELMPASMRKHGGHIAFKTGTSWGFRDALAVGFDSRWVIGVWVGKPSGAPNPGQFGAKTAAPILFDLFAMMPDEKRPTDNGSQGEKTWSAKNLSPNMKHFDRPPLMRFTHQLENPPVIQFPVPNSSLKMPRAKRPILIETEGGVGQLSMLVNGKVVIEPNLQGMFWWKPTTIGFHNITIVDEAGQSTRASVRILP